MRRPPRLIVGCYQRQPHCILPFHDGVHWYDVPLGHEAKAALADSASTIVTVAIFNMQFSIGAPARIGGTR